MNISVTGSIRPISFPFSCMSYVDGFLIPLPKKNLKAYKKMAQWGKKKWMGYGALDYKECVADDLKCEGGVPYTTLLNLKKGETVVFAFIVFKSRKHRDAVNKKVMSDPEMNNPELAKKMKMPFDPKRMSYGGFAGIVEA
jgi:uncharacterized protein YbaA (DUF1428 family)